MVILNRREFIAASAAASVTAISADALSVSNRSQEKPWYSNLRLCGHLNFNEQDPLTMDVEAWTDYFVSLKVGALMPNGGGIVAFYPTEVPYHHRSQFLGSRDLFGESVAAARRHDLRVVARMDPNYAYEDAFKAHPEWFECNKDGSARRHAECPWLYKTCLFSPYFSEQIPAIYRELNSRYAPDAFYTNGWPGTEALGVCHCPNCQKVYREQTGGVPPESTDASSPVYRKYYEVYMDRVAAIWKQWQQTVEEKSPQCVYAGNLSGVRAVKDVHRLGKAAAWFYADNQGRSGDAPIWMCAQEGRLAWAIAGDRGIANSVGSYASGTPGWRHTSKTKEEAILWMAQAVASGMTPSYHWLGGQPLDTRWKETGRAFFSWVDENKRHFRNRNTLADIAVLYPQSTISFYATKGTRERKLNGQVIDSTDYLAGMYAALLHGRFLFDVVHQNDLNTTTLKKYRALVIPNAAYLRDSECEAVRSYVAAGGSVLATFETSRYNEWGEPRSGLALADLFGAGATGQIIGPFGNSYMHIDRSHPVIEGFEGTTILPGAEFRVPIALHGDAHLHLSVIPNYPAYPPEMVYPRTPRTNEPAAVFREQGAARIVYFPGDVDRTFLRSGHPDFSRLIGNAIRWMLKGQEPQVSVEGEGLVELFSWETEPGFSLHILNYTNPALNHPFLSGFYPTGPLQVRFQVPDQRRIGSVRALRAGKDLSFRQSRGTLSFEAPPVADYEVIALT